MDAGIQRAFDHPEDYDWSGRGICTCLRQDITDFIRTKGRKPSRIDIAPLALAEIFETVTTSILNVYDHEDFSEIELFGILIEQKVQDVSWVLVD